MVKNRNRIYSSNPPNYGSFCDFSHCKLGIMPFSCLVNQIAAIRLEGLGKREAVPNFHFGKRILFRGSTPLNFRDWNSLADLDLICHKTQFWGLHNRYCAHGALGLSSPICLAEPRLVRVLSHALIITSTNIFKKMRNSFYERIILLKHCSTLVRSPLKMQQIN